nr:hypothetical protein [uncultured bacterium]
MSCRRYRERTAKVVETRLRMLLSKLGVGPVKSAIEKNRFDSRLPDNAPFAVSVDHVG